jgi:hypothetical protein
MDQNSSEFKALQKKWYTKLKKSGFEDHEDIHGHLKCDGSENLRRRSKDPNRIGKEPLFTSRVEYYRLAGQFYWEHKFADDVEKRIWERHKEGISIRDIVKAMRSSKLKIHRRMVHETIQRLARHMLNKAKYE